MTCDVISWGRGKGAACIDPYWKHLPSSLHTAAAGLLYHPRKVCVFMNVWSGCMWMKILKDVIFAMWRFLSRLYLIVGPLAINVKIMRLTQMWMSLCAGSKEDWGQNIFMSKVEEMQTVILFAAVFQINVSHPPFALKKKMSPRFEIKAHCFHYSLLNVFNKVVNLSFVRYFYQNYLKDLQCVHTSLCESQCATETWSALIFSFFKAIIIVISL